VAHNTAELPLVSSRKCPRKSEPEPKIDCDICGESTVKSRITRAPKCHDNLCGDCIREIFTGATKDVSRMPPSCCYFLPIHLALPYLTAEEAALYRARFEEWSTAKKVYCPIPHCSAFIPSRLLPKLSQDGKVINPPQKTDSPAIRKPAGKTPKLSIYPIIAAFPCPECNTDLCASCKQVHHPGHPCPSGMNLDVLDLVLKWGYKLCPACNNGVRRMYGCVSPDHLVCSTSLTSLLVSHDPMPEALTHTEPHEMPLRRKLVLGLPPITRTLYAVPRLPPR